EEFLQPLRGQIRGNLLRKLQRDFRTLSLFSFILVRILLRVDRPGTYSHLNPVEDAFLVFAAAIEFDRNRSIAQLDVRHGDDASRFDGTAVLLDLLREVFLVDLTAVGELHAFRAKRHLDTSRGLLSGNAFNKEEASVRRKLRPQRNRQTQRNYNP